MVIYQSNRNPKTNITSGRHHGSMNREDFISISRYESHVTKQPFYSELIKALQHDRTVRVAGKKPSSSCLARLQVGRDAHLAAPERNLHVKARRSQRAAGRKRYKRALCGNAGPPKGKRSPQHRSGHTDARPTAGPMSAADLNSDRSAGESSPEAVTGPLRLARPAPSSSAAALGAGEGPTRTALRGCRPPGSAPRRAAAAPSAVPAASPRPPAWPRAGPGTPAWA